MSSPRYCDSVDDTGRNTYNTLDVALAPGVAKPDVGVERNFYTRSSCGVCGKAADVIMVEHRGS
jgi:FdhD protein